MDSTRSMLYAAVLVILGVTYSPTLAQPRSVIAPGDCISEENFCYRPDICTYVITFPAQGDVCPAIEDSISAIDAFEGDLDSLRQQVSTLTATVNAIQARAAGEWKDFMEQLQTAVLQQDQRINALEAAQPSIEEGENVPDAGSRVVSGLPCIFLGKIYSDGHTWQENACSNCTCTNSTTLCNTISCEIPKCRRPIFPEGVCCPVCPTTPPPPQFVSDLPCIYSGKIYVDGHTWQENACTSCTCTNSTTLCNTISCEIPKCRRPISPEGVCCPICPTTPPPPQWSSEEVDVYELTGTASQSSSRRHPRKDASRAIDGNGNPDWYDGTLHCSQTELEHEPWWKMDLGRTYSVIRVIITNRGDCCSERIDGAVVLVGNSEAISENEQCGDQVVWESKPYDAKIQFECSLNGQYVGVMLRHETNFLTLCEVQVYGAII